MSQQTITEEGAFQKSQRDQVNANFTELYTAVGDFVTYSLNTKIAAISLTATELGGSETNTSFTSPTNGMILLNAWLNVTDNEAASTVDVGTQGTSNDPDGILDGASVATAGYVGQVPAAKGALLGCFIPGSDPVSVTASGDLNSCEATLYLHYIELPAA